MFEKSTSPSVKVQKFREFFHGLRDQHLDPRQNGEVNLVVERKTRLRLRPMRNVLTRAAQREIGGSSSFSPSDVRTVQPRNQDSRTLLRSFVP